MAGRTRTRRAFGKITKKGARYYVEYTGPDGKIHTPGRSFHSKIDVEGWLSAERRLIELDTWEPPKVRLGKQQEQQQRDFLTVGQWVLQWLERQEARLKLSTWQSYRRVIRNRITEVTGAPGVSKLADTPLHSLSKQLVHEWWDELNAHFSTPQTNRRAYVYLRAAIADAVERELLPANPVHVRQAGKKPQPIEKELPTTETLLAIVGHVSPRYKLAMALCLFMGLRVGEALALTREHLVNTGTDEQPQWVAKVRGNLQRLQDEDGRTFMHWQEPKTKAGRRDVPIFPQFNGIVAAHLESFAPTEPGGYLTTTHKGNPVMDTSFRSVLERAREAAGVKQKITPHYGRNWFITHLAENGATPAEIGHLLGQTDLKTITETYMKVRPDNMAAVLSKVGVSVEETGKVASLDAHRAKKGHALGASKEATGQ